MTGSAIAILWIAGLYAGAGLIVALAFAAVGAPRLVGERPGEVSVSLGARLILMPGAIVLWPLILQRWLKAPL
jgi:hypothetical protein